MTARRLPAKDLRWTCPGDWIPSKSHSRTTSKVTAGLFGQSLALDAIQMGLAVNAPGYNVFICGIGGARKAETVVHLLEELRLDCPLPQDHLYVHHFAEPLCPQHLTLPTGGGALLAEAMERWVRTLSREIPELLESEQHLARRSKLFRRYRNAEAQLFRRFGTRLQAQGLDLVSLEQKGKSTRDIFFRIGDKPIPPQALDELPKSHRPSAKQKEKLFALREDALTALRVTQRKSRSLALRLLRESQAQDAEVVQEAVESLTLALAEELDADLPLGSWLGDCAMHAVNQPQLFLRGNANQDAEAIGLEVFAVNTIRSGSADACPIVYEQHPNYSKLFGTLERSKMREGMGHIHEAVRPGSLLAADGGFLVLNARDVFKEAEVWRALKRTLQTGLLEIHALESLSPLGITGARPAPIPLDLKVILVGDSSLYEFLHDDDFDFPQIFKVKAEFKDTLPLHKKNVSAFSDCIKERIADEGLLPFSKTGLQALVERAVTDAGRRNRLSARFEVMSDYAREASFYAQRKGKRRVDKAAVEESRIGYRNLHALDHEWHLRDVLEGIYRLDTEGTSIGSLNGLTVVGLGPVSFGRPARVSAVVGAGEENYLNIERDVDLSGPIHNKGVLMLESYMRHRFGRTRTLPYKVSLAFDQSYGPIDGDSASSTEVYALLSALGGFALRQDLAVTGAVDMKGNVMAVGGVNAKIRGFFELCNARGLSGTQGILLPHANVNDLMLDQEIITAVRKRQFHIHSVTHIDEGLKLLTGMTASQVSKAVNTAMDALEKAKESKESKESAGKG